MIRSIFKCFKSIILEIKIKGKVNKKIKKKKGKTNKILTKVFPKVFKNFICFQNILIFSKIIREFFKNKFVFKILSFFPKSLGGPRGFRGSPRGYFFEETPSLALKTIYFSRKDLVSL